MEPKFNINTAQNVNIELKIAGVGERLAALLIDYLIIAGGGIAFALLFSQVPIDNGIKMILMAIYGFVAFLYHFLMEWLYNGQTIGKKYRNIKVVHKSGAEANVFQLLIRNLVRVIDSLYGFGLVFVFFTKKSQRLGDLAGATIVVKQNTFVTAEQTVVSQVEQHYQPAFDKVQVLRLNESDIELVKTVANRPIMNLNWAHVKNLAETIQKKTEIAPGDMKDLEFLQRIQKDFTYFHQE